MFQHLENLLLELAYHIPLYHFAWLASFVEEVIAPIPSPIVMIVTGSLARVQEYPLLGLIPLALLGALGKTVGAFVVYTVSDIAEDVIMQGRIARFVGVTHEEVESFGARLTGGARDYVLLSVLRMLPIIPSVLISVGSGIIGIPRILFLTSTFLGTIVRDGIYLYVGYVGIATLHTAIDHATLVESYVEYTALGGMGILLLYIGARRWVRN
jgi:membrane protein DedA with SNARE-associated domain